MKTLLNKISTDEILQEAAKLLKAAFNSTNMHTRYHLFQEANDLKCIAKKLYKYEEMKNRGDL